MTQASNLQFRARPFYASWMVSKAACTGWQLYLRGAWIEALPPVLDELRKLRG